MCLIVYTLHYVLSSHMDASLNTVPLDRSPYNSWSYRMDLNLPSFSKKKGINQKQQLYLFLGTFAHCPPMTKDNLIDI